MVNYFIVPTRIFDQLYRYMPIVEINFSLYFIGLNVWLHCHLPWGEIAELSLEILTKLKMP